MIGCNVRSNDFYSSKRNLIVSKDIFKNRRHSHSKLSNTVAKKICEKNENFQMKNETVAFSRVLTQSRVNDISHERRSTKRRRATEKVSFQTAVRLPFFRCPDLNGPERERATSRQCLRQSRLRPIFQRRRKRITCCSLLYRVHKPATRPMFVNFAMLLVGTWHFDVLKWIREETLVETRSISNELMAEFRKLFCVIDERSIVQLVEWDFAKGRDQSEREHV